VHGTTGPQHFRPDFLVLLVLIFHREMACSIFRFLAHSNDTGLYCTQICFFESLEGFGLSFGNQITRVILANQEFCSGSH
jgi:hypothetical protein